MSAYVCISRTAELILIKFHIRNFYLNLLMQLNFGYDQTAITGTLHKKLCIFMHAEVIVGKPYTDSHIAM